MIPDHVREAARVVGRRLGDAGPISAGIVLGSGLDGVAAMLRDARELPQSDIPGYPAARVSGHRGAFAMGQLGEASVAVSAGRAHLYEGHSLETVAFPVRLLHALGAQTLVLTAAVGGIHPELEAGDLVLVTDHLNLLGASPLTAPDGAPCFLDLTECYDRQMRGRALDSAFRAGEKLAQGVLAAVRGPHYETPAEVRMLRALGADMVCMSLVPEAIVARQLGMRVMALVVVANRAAGTGPGPIAHLDVLRTVEARASSVAQVLSGVFSREP